MSFYIPFIRRYCSETATATTQFNSLAHSRTLRTPGNCTGFMAECAQIIPGTSILYQHVLESQFTQCTTPGRKILKVTTNSDPNNSSNFNRSILWIANKIHISLSLSFTWCTDSLTHSLILVHRPAMQNFCIAVAGNRVPNERKDAFPSTDETEMTTERTEWVAKTTAKSDRTNIQDETKRETRFAVHEYPSGGIVVVVGVTDEFGACADPLSGVCFVFLSFPGSFLAH